MAFGQIKKRMLSHPFFYLVLFLLFLKFVRVAEAAAGGGLEEEEVLVRLHQADDSDVHPVLSAGVADKVLVRGDRVALRVGDAETGVDPVDDHVTGQAQDEITREDVGRIRHPHQRQRTELLVAVVGDDLSHAVGIEQRAVQIVRHILAHDVLVLPLAPEEEGHVDPHRWDQQPPGHIMTRQLLLIDLQIAGHQRLHLRRDGLFGGPRGGLGRGFRRGLRCGCRGRRGGLPGHVLFGRGRSAAAACQQQAGTDAQKQDSFHGSASPPFPDSGYFSLFVILSHLRALFKRALSRSCVPPPAGI